MKKFLTKKLIPRGMGGIPKDTIVTEDARAYSIYGVEKRLVRYNGDDYWVDDRDLLEYLAPDQFPENLKPKVKKCK